MSLKGIENISNQEQVKLMILIGKTIIECVEKEDLRIEKEITKGIIAIEKA